MTKAEIARRIAEDFGLSKNKAFKIVDAITEEIVLALARGEEVWLRPLGYMYVRQHRRKGGELYNPRVNKRPSIVPECYTVVYVKLSKQAKEMLLGGKT